MEKITKKIHFVENKDIFVNILLTEKSTPIGVYDEIQNENPVINQPINNIIITGITEDRLTEVRTYNTTNPYVVGTNGVTNVIRDGNNNVTDVYYIIDTINYHTDIINNITIYGFTGSGGSLMNDNFLYKDDTLLGITERPDINNNINIERQQISVVEPLLLIQSVRTLEDVDDLIADSKV